MSTCISASLTLHARAFYAIYYSNFMCVARCHILVVHEIVESIYMYVYLYCTFAAWEYMLQILYIIITVTQYHTKTKSCLYNAFCYWIVMDDVQSIVHQKRKTQRNIIYHLIHILGSVIYAIQNIYANYFSIEQKTQWLWSIRSRGSMFNATDKILRS